MKKRVAYPVEVKETESLRCPIKDSPSRSIMSVAMTDKFFYWFQSFH